MDFSSCAPTLDPFGAFLSRAQGRVGEGPLAGVRLCVKDNIALEGEPFTAGHPLFAERRADTTATAVRVLLDAGASFVGMTRTDAGGFGMTTPDVSNPVFPGHIAGGSSGGAAAAVASGKADLGLGTDTGGSVRVPAASTGLFGFKPTRGTIPLDGIFPLAASFDHVGFIAKDLDLLETALTLFVSSPTRMGKSNRPLRIAVDERMPEYADTTMRSAFQTVIGCLRKAGHHTEACSLPDRFSFAEAFGALVVAEAAPIYKALPINKLGRAAIHALRHADSIDVTAVRNQLTAWSTTFRECLEACDLLISPTLHIPLPLQHVHKVDSDGKVWPLLLVLLGGTCFANALGAPALAIPLPLGPSPFSLHLACRPKLDFELLDAARQIQAVFGRMAAS